MKKAGRAIWEADLFVLSLTLLSGSIIICKLKQGILPLSSLSSPATCLKLAVLLTWLSVVTKECRLHTPTRAHPHTRARVTNTGTLIEEQLHIPQQEGGEQQLRVMESIP